MSIFAKSSLKKLEVSADQFNRTCNLNNIEIALNRDQALIRAGDNAVKQKQIEEATQKLFDIEELKKENFYDGTELTPGYNEIYAQRSAFNYHLLLGLGVAMVLLSAASLYLSYRDLCNYYHVDYTPIPRYMVDEEDLTAFNSKGEQIVIKNQAAYYKVVECNGVEGDGWYDKFGTYADLNGGVGRQWLALYVARNENKAPILASSLKAVVGSANVPSGYQTGIHMFGSSAAYNFNNSQIVWNNKAPSVFVYFKVDETAASDAAATGSVLTTGYLVLTAVAGLAVGVLGVVCVTAITKKKKVRTAAAV